MAELNWEPSVNATHIGVEVAGGVVTLAGHVGSYTEKWDAERAAQRVSGVKALAVEMDVKLAGSSKRSDTEIARSAGNVLEWTTYLPKDSVKVMVENGWITLTGELEWEYQGKAALSAVRSLMGVTGVSDQLSIKQSVSVDSVKTDIEAALKRRAVSDASKIFVEVSGAKVTLRGTVQSWAAHELALSSAWGTAGVHNVVDNIAVAY